MPFTYNSGGQLRAQDVVVRQSRSGAIACLREFGRHQEQKTVEFSGFIEFQWDGL